MIKIPSHKDNILQFVRGYKKCTHTGRYIVDPDLAYVTCAGCGAELNPMFVLRELANNEHILNKETRSLKIQAKEAGKMNRCKCEHCEKMTRIKK